VIGIYWEIEVGEEDLVNLISVENVVGGTYTIDFNALLDIFSRYGIAARGYRMSLEG